MGTICATALVCSGPVRAEPARDDALSAGSCRSGVGHPPDLATGRFTATAPVRPQPLKNVPMPVPAASSRCCRPRGPIGTTGAIQGRNRLERPEITPCATCVTGIKKAAQGHGVSDLRKRQGANNPAT
ncbi:hypothetical protein GCM10023217_32110 [Gordonia alkaliphila]|uniref:Uncharacterized protein n=1 Tax=Gordonia alkaliphila TaxID=1053547 RepID=A0ABP8ZJ40_9ACTN